MRRPWPAISPPIRKSASKRLRVVLGYRPNQLARSLRSSRNHTLGVMVFDITDPYCTPIVRGIENSLYQASFVPILADAHNDRGPLRGYLEMLLERRVEGLVVVANWMLVDINLLADMEKRNIPDRDHRARTATWLDQFSACGQRSRRKARARTSIFDGTPEDRIHPRAEDAGGY